MRVFEKDCRHPPPVRRQDSSSTGQPSTSTPPVELHRCPIAPRSCTKCAPCASDQRTTPLWCGHSQPPFQGRISPVGSPVLADARAAAASRACRTSAGTSAFSAAAAAAVSCDSGRGAAGRSSAGSAPGEGSVVGSAPSVGSAGTAGSVGSPEAVGAAEAPGASWSGATVSTARAASPPAPSRA